MRRIYIAGPIGALDEGRPARIQAAIVAGRDLLVAGFCPVVPHLWAAVRTDADEILSYEQWMAHGFALLDACHALLRIPGHSPGSDREVARATAACMPVFYCIGVLLAHARTEGWPLVIP